MLFKTKTVFQYLFYNVSFLGGLFGSTSTSTFGQTNTAFGQPATNTFGGQAANTSFGASSAFKPTGFGGTTTQSGGGLFGSSTTTQSGGLFGNTQTQSNFGAAATPFGQTAANTSAFGQTNAFGGGGAFGAGGVSQDGTGHTKFQPTTSTDTMMKQGQQSQISTRHQCITCMKEYENKSLEELRCEDYIANKKGGGGAAAGGTAGGLFGQGYRGDLLRWDEIFLRKMETTKCRQLYGTRCKFNCRCIP